MLKLKPFIVLGVILFAVTLLVPTFLVLPFMEKSKDHNTLEEAEATKNIEPSIEVAIYRESKKEIEKLDLEDYVVGVVASEVPADFEMEALKAQALTARTYIARRMLSGEKSADLPEGVIVGDSINYQVYNNREDLKKIWTNLGRDWKGNIKKIEEAVAATKGQILTFDGNPIDATFFSTSNGYTENSEDVFTNSMSYLKSVESPWDLNSPKFNGKETKTVAEVEKSLGVTLDSKKGILEDVKYTAGKRIATVKIGGKEFTGIDVRKKLNLKSTDFTMTRDGNNVTITTKGYGHGVGMSQYGANGMAAAGKSYKDIVTYYYKGVEVVQSSEILTKYTAKN